MVLPRFLRDAPIRRKLTAITMATTAFALLLVCAGFISYEQVTARRQLVDSMHATARMLGDNSAAALSFHDPESAQQTLRSLYTLSAVEAAVVYDREGAPFAIYQANAAARAPFVPPSVAPQGERFGPETLEVFHAIVLTGEQIGTVYLRVPLRELDANTRRKIAWTLGVLVFASLLAWPLAHRLSRLIAEPVAQLAEAMGVVAKVKDYGVRVTKVGNDEFGRLMDGFNDMLAEIHQRDVALREARDTLERRVEDRTRHLLQEIAERQRAETQLEHTHKQLVDASRQAGMAEVATNVLHNVGNVLNSVNVSANIVVETVQHSRAGRIGQVAQLLQEHAGDLGTFLTADPRGRQVPGYLTQLAEHVKSEHDAIGRELTLLRKHIDHIIEIVAMQQNYARVTGVTEMVDVRELVHDSLRMNAGALARHGVAVEHEFAEVPRMALDRHRVLQILVNLIRNAKYACEESGRHDKRIRVRVDNDGGRIRISVSDNGVGIPPENLTRIFSHGFTTRKEGHGFGLHSGALAAKEMGGALTVHSDGPGRGATFTLDIPVGAKGEHHVPH